jgi:hypothetical protein
MRAVTDLAHPIVYVAFLLILVSACVTAPAARTEQPLDPCAGCADPETWDVPPPVPGAYVAPEGDDRLEGDEPKREAPER